MAGMIEPIIPATITVRALIGEFTALLERLKAFLAEETSRLQL